MGAGSFIVDSRDPDECGLSDRERNISVALAINTTKEKQ